MSGVDLPDDDDTGFVVPAQVSLPPESMATPSPQPGILKRALEDGCNVTPKKLCFAPPSLILQYRRVQWSG